MSRLIQAAIAIVAAFPMLALAAPATDVQDFNDNGAGYYFVPSDALTLSSPYYRMDGEDWGWTHGSIGGSGFGSIKVSVSAYDVDFDNGELDLIQAFDGSSWVDLGYLAGSDNTYAFTVFDLTGYSWAQSQVNAGLQLRIDIDTTREGWQVTLAKSTLDIDGGALACVPAPGVPCTPIGPTDPNEIPEPGTLALIGLALAGTALSRRRTARA